MLLVESLGGLVPVAALSDVLALVLGWVADERGREMIWLIGGIALFILTSKLIAAVIVTSGDEGER